MIEAARLTKRFRNNVAVQDLSFTVQTGSIAGFLGPNGSGKSTTMRMMCGLMHVTSGASSFDGRDYRSYANPARKVGVLLDAGALHAGRTGRGNLMSNARLLGVPERTVDRLLEFVGLTASEGRALVGSYSLGMKQRLGIANAMLGDPDYLMLDEPANGLDPSGIHWLRDALAEFAHAGGTVLLSSHLLREIEVIADEFVLIADGRLMRTGRMSDVAQDAAVLVKAENRALLEDALAGEGIPFVVDNEYFLIDAEPRIIGSLALKYGIVVTEMRPSSGSSLESLYLNLVEEKSRDV